MIPVTVCFGDQAMATQVGDIPGVRSQVWRGAGEAPAAVRSAQILVPGRDATVWLSNGLHRLPNLRLVQLLVTGADRWHEELPSNVVLCTGQDAHSASTAELAIALLLYRIRRLDRVIASQAEERWAPFVADTISQRRIMVLGTGSIGRRIAEIVRILGAQPTLVARTARPGIHSFRELGDLAPEHDVLLIAIPLTDETRHLVDSAILRSMPDGSVIVNVGRGGVIDTRALATELQSGRLSAALDVVEPEPLPAGHPLWHTPHTLISPHVGGGAQGWEARAGTLVREQITSWIAGRPLRNVVLDR